MDSVTYVVSGLIYMLYACWCTLSLTNQNHDVRYKILRRQKTLGNWLFASVKHPERKIMSSEKRDSVKKGIEESDKVHDRLVSLEGYLLTKVWVMAIVAAVLLFNVFPNAPLNMFPKSIYAYLAFQITVEWLCLRWLQRYSVEYVASILKLGD